VPPGFFSLRELGIRVAHARQVDRPRPRADLVQQIVAARVGVKLRHLRIRVVQRAEDDRARRAALLAGGLELTVEDAFAFLRNVPIVSAKLKTLIEVGLTYVRLGQNATTLSGGEAQRIKLARELSKRATGRTLYILDEPTTGLHFHDIAQLLGVLGRLRDQGNTVIVIEHNLDVIKTADWVIDLGPEGGDGGGEIVAVGTPEQIAAHPSSFTGEFLRRTLAKHRARG